jgi:hypothetical protein
MGQLFPPIVLHGLEFDIPCLPLRQDWRESKVIDSKGSLAATSILTSEILGQL